MFQGHVASDDNLSRAGIPTIEDGVDVARCHTGHVAYDEARVPEGGAEDLRKESQGNP